MTVMIDAAVESGTDGRESANNLEMVSDSLTKWSSSVGGAVAAHGLAGEAETEAGGSAKKAHVQSKEAVAFTKGGSCELSR